MEREIETFVIPSTWKDTNILELYPHSRRVERPPKKRVLRSRTIRWKHTPRNSRFGTRKNPIIVPDMTRAEAEALAADRRMHAIPLAEVGHFLFVPIVNPNRPMSEAQYVAEMEEALGPDFIGANEYQEYLDDWEANQQWQRGEYPWRDCIPSINLPSSNDVYIPSFVSRSLPASAAVVGDDGFIPKDEGVFSHGLFIQ